MSEKILSIRNMLKYPHEGYAYVLDRISANGSVKFWRCERRNDSCKARIHTCAVTGVFIKMINEHNHGSDPANVAVQKIKSNIKRRAILTQELPSQIINKTLEQSSTAVQGKISTNNASRKMIQRIRNRSLAAPVQPLNLATIVIPHRYRTYNISNEQTENFVLADSGEGDEKRILLFGRHSNISWTHLMKKLYVDGTFSISPPLFSQIFVIMVERSGFIVPVVYALLPNKESITYRRTLQMLKQTWPALNPTFISCDFEQAVIGSFQAEFSQASMNGCLFHLSKNIRKRLGDEHLITRYNSEPEFSLMIRMIIALAFIPPLNVVNAFEELLECLPEDIHSVMNSFESTYIGRLNSNGTRRRPMFPIEIWSVYQRTLDDESRTNIHVEAAHRRLQAELGVEHPNLWKFIDALNIVQKGRDAYFEQYVRGDHAPIKRKKYVEADKRIKTIVRSYETRIFKRHS